MRIVCKTCGSRFGWRPGRLIPRRYIATLPSSPRRPRARRGESAESFEDRVRTYEADRKRHFERAWALVLAHDKEERVEEVRGHMDMLLRHNRDWFDGNLLAPVVCWDCIGKMLSYFDRCRMPIKGRPTQLQLDAKVLKWICHLIKGELKKRRGQAA